MKQEITKQQSLAMLKWLNQNLQMLLDNYSASFIAYNENGVIASGKNWEKVMETAEKSGIERSLLYYPPPARNRNM